MSSTGTYGHGINPQNSNGTICWSEIFARHEAVLSSHMEMLSLVKGQIAPEVAASQTVSSMMKKTVQAMNQLKIARKQMMNKPPNATSASIPSKTPPTTDTEANTRKKRRRVSQEKAPVHPESEAAEESRSSKRSCDNSSQSSGEPDGGFTSTSLETEDISAEVQRRLKIREEMRQRRTTPWQEKRKRDSMASNDDTSPTEATARPHKKRAKMSVKVKNEWKRGSDQGDEVDTVSKKRRRTP